MNAKKVLSVVLCTGFLLSATACENASVEDALSDVGTVVTDAADSLSKVGLDKINVEDAFDIAGIKEISGGTLYKETAEVDTVGDNENDKELGVYPEGINKMAMFVYIFDSQEEVIEAFTSYGKYLLENEWTERIPNNDLMGEKDSEYISNDDDYMVKLHYTDSLGGDWEKEGYGGKYALYTSIYFGD